MHTKKLILFLLLLSGSGYGQQYRWQNVVPQTDASFRGLSVIDDNVAWVSGSKGWVGRSTNAGNTWSFAQVKGYEKCDFRSLYAFDAQTAVIANAGAPAYVLYTKDGGANWDLVYRNDDSAAFFDGIGFWNSKEGILYGDPIKGKMLLLATNDGGHTWQELPGESRPVMAEGEASFAASGTTIRCLKNDKLVIATGGKVSRLLISENKGRNWRSVSTPILQGQNSSGVFSIAFHEDKTAIIVGGDYKKDTLAKDHVFYTRNQGKTWSAPAAPTRGYRECVEYINSKIVVATGPTGTDISYNGGANWEPLSDEKQYHVIKKSRKGNLIILAGGNGKISLLK